ncbi:MAG: hypothetical protein RR313_04250 [Anaerovoracaceae bacterium]
MKKFLKWFMVFTIFFIGTLAILQVDNQCFEMTGSGGVMAKFEIF